MEQEHDGDKPALPAGQVGSDKQPDLSVVGNLWKEDEEDRDSTSLNANSVEYLSANEILAKIKRNPINKNGTAANEITATKQVSTSLPMCGVELIKKFEGCYLKAYPDPLTGGKPITIGWGSTRKRDGSPWYLGESISQQEADELLIYQLETSYLPDLMKIPCWSELNPNQQGALLSFGYNLGSKFYGASNFESMTRVIKNRDWANIRETFLKYRNPGSNVEQGLRRRREAEAELFLKPYS
ncbi:glycoside hydrolase family protein [Scytonema sp. UIC 10036]|nr:glycoside hydrolase family protein [Scytonema sp. UIC 10036]